MIAMLLLKYWIPSGFILAQCAILAVFAVQVRRTHRMRFGPFWAALQDDVIMVLHHPHAKSERMDLLMENLQSLTITPGQTEELKVLVKKVAEDTALTRYERNCAEFLLFSIPLVIKERADAKK